MKIIVQMKGDGSDFPKSLYGSAFANFITQQKAIIRRQLKLRRKDEIEIYIDGSLVAREVKKEV